MAEKQHTYNFSLETVDHRNRLSCTDINLINIEVKKKVWANWSLTEGVGVASTIQVVEKKMNCEIVEGFMDGVAGQQ